ncbi:MAG: hypothetical protein C5B50_13335 [Verrucomicrobia bacterium]|nr:MAG: hypothetical protein C5B50_13335 [Verrucomicrobiota bacterium]
MRLIGLAKGGFCSFLLGIASVTFAQTTTFPVVTIYATVPNATWSGNPGVFTVVRTGDASAALNVYYAIGGTALNCSDYVECGTTNCLGHFVFIPAGVYSNQICIKPRPVSNTGACRSVILTLTNSPTLNPVNYSIGTPSTATVNICSGTSTDLPPVAAWVYPTNGSVFYNPPGSASSAVLNLPLEAAAYDQDGFVTQVEFFANGKSLGVVSNSSTVTPYSPSPMPATFPPMPPYRLYVLIWSNAPPGTNIQLYATASDNGGLKTSTTPVSITIHPGPPPPPPPQTNPIVRITSPPNNSSFRAPINLPIYAYAIEFGGTIASVEFFAGTNDLGAGRQLPSPSGNPLPSTFWTLTWSNAAVGGWPLRAVATDAKGVSTTSDPVNVTILPPVTNPPPTDVVVVTAIDPIAIEGTNCFPWLGLTSASPTWSNWGSSNCCYRYFTNCGPKNALFAVRRFGNTNFDVIVFYAVGGTCSNGTDYVSLPGTVTIPAGHRVALVPVVPIDDGAPDISCTVVLKLKPSPIVGPQPTYDIGYPASAAALILDAPSWPPPTARLPDGTFHVNASGPDGAWFHVECTSDLSTWTSICTNQVFNGSVDFLDPDAQNAPVRFYRAVPEANTPQ